MLFKHALGEVIRGHRHAKGMTLRDVADKQFMSFNYLSEVERGHKELSSSFLIAVAKSLEVEPYELIIAAGLLMASYEIPDTPAELIDTALAVG